MNEGRPRRCRPRSREGETEGKGTHEGRRRTYPSGVIGGVQSQKRARKDSGDEKVRFHLISCESLS